MKTKVNSITYGAVIIALVGALLLVNRQFAGFLDIYLLWIIPLPIIVYSIKFSTKQALIMCVAMLFASIIVTGMNFITILYLIEGIVAGVAYSYGVEKEKGAGFLIASVFVVSLITAVITTFLAPQFFGYNLADEIEFLKTTLTEVMEKSIGGVSGSNDLISSILSYDFLIKIYVISTILTSAMEGVLVHMLAYLVLRRLNMKLPPMKPIGQLFAPAWLKFFVFTAFLAYYGSLIFKVTDYNDIILPIMAIAQIVCFVFGYIFLLVFLTLRIRNRKTVSMIMMLVILLFVFTAQIVVALGVVDMFTSLRRLALERIAFENASTK